MSRSGIRYRHGMVDLRSFVERLIDGDEPESLIAARWPQVREIDGITRHQHQRLASAFAFHKPIRRAYRLSTSDGRTSFHFSHKIVVQKAESLMIGRVQIQAGAASEHCRYIEREGAVASVLDRQSTHSIPTSMQINAASVAYQENDDDLRPYVGHYLGFGASAEVDAGQHESRNLRSALFRTDREGAAGDRLLAMSGSDVGPLGWRTDLLLRHHAARRMDEAQPDPQGSMRGQVGGVGALGERTEAKGRGRGARSIAADHRSYLERPDAVARQPDGALALVTNIANEPEVRQKFWQAVEENESKRGGDRMSLDFSKAPDFWSRVAADERCPTELRAALKSDDDSDRQRFEIPDGKAMRAFLQTVPGWVAKRKKSPGESSKDNAQISAPLAKFHDGRGGRIQQRIIFELPSEGSISAHMRILKRLCYEFERRGIPFNAVIHAPDHGSDERQWHVHLDYYHRPVRRLTQVDVEMAKARGLVPDGDVVGEWDFAARFFEGKRRDRSRRPFRQDTVEEVREEGWIPYLRSRLAFIVNDELRAEGHYPRYDPRSYHEMGIKADPAEHLGVKLNAAEGKGEVSAIGLANEQKQWAAIEEKLRAKNLADRDAIEAAAITRRKRLSVLNIPSDQAAAVASGIESLVDWSMRGADADYEAAVAHELAARACSRANYVFEKSDRLLRASAAGKISLSAKERDQRLTLLEASTAFLGRLQPFRDAVQDTVQRCDATRAEAEKMARVFERVVEGLLSDAEAQARGDASMPVSSLLIAESRKVTEDSHLQIPIVVADRVRAEWLDQLLRRRPIVRSSQEGFHLGPGENRVGIQDDATQRALGKLFAAQEREVDALLGDPAFSRRLNRQADGWHYHGRGAEIARRFLVLRDHPRVADEIVRIATHPGAAASALSNRSPVIDPSPIANSVAPPQSAVDRSMTSKTESIPSKNPQSVTVTGSKPDLTNTSSFPDATDVRGHGHATKVSSISEPAKTSVHHLIANRTPLFMGADGRIDAVALRKRGIVIDEGDRADARLIGRAKAQADHARRAVVGFIKKAPSFIEEHGGRYTLSPKVKADIAALARDYDSPALQTVLKLAWEEYRELADEHRSERGNPFGPRSTDLGRDDEAIAAAKAYHDEQRRRASMPEVAERAHDANAGKAPQARPEISETPRRPPPGWDRGGQGR